MFSGCFFFLHIMKLSFFFFFSSSLKHILFMAAFMLSTTTPLRARFCGLKAIYWKDVYLPRIRSVAYLNVYNKVLLYSRQKAHHRFLAPSRLFFPPSKNVVFLSNSFDVSNQASRLRLCSLQQGRLFFIFISNPFLKRNLRPEPDGARRTINKGFERP